MLSELFPLLLVLVMCIAPQAAHQTKEHDRTPMYHVPRRLRQTRLFAPTDRNVNHQLPNTYHGDPLGPKAKGHMRILLNNPNIISVQNDFVDFQYICQRMLSHDVDIWGPPKSGVYWKQGNPQNHCNQIPKDCWSLTLS
jgi:hypothetical protein